MKNEDLKRYLAILEIVADDVSTVTLRDANLAFQKIALIVHPDKAGKESTAAFQRLRDAYERVRNHFKEKINLDDESIVVTDEETRFFDDNFEKFNFPFENKGSFTVRIEDSIADFWQNCLTEQFGEAKVKINGRGTECDRHWKVEYGQEKRIEITIHIYNKPKNKKGSKLMLQGSIQSMICSFVFEELPKIYKNQIHWKGKEKEIVKHLEDHW